MPEYEAGLHKKISAIFDGVPIPNSDSIAPPPYVPDQNQALAVAPEPPAPAQQTSQQFSPPPPRETAPQPSVNKSQAPPPPSPKAASPKTQKTDAAAVAAQSTLNKLFTKLKTKLLKPKRGTISARQKVMTVLVPVLFVIFIFVFVRLFSAPARKPAGPPKAVKKDTAVAADKISWKVPAPWPETFRDPMKLVSATTASAENSDIVIRGIVYSDDNPAVIIGTQVLHQGAKVAGATVIKINEDEVEFEMNGKKWTQKVQH